MVVWNYVTPYRANLFEYFQAAKEIFIDHLVTHPPAGAGRKPREWWRCCPLGGGVGWLFVTISYMIELIKLAN